jgi:hypothetical protein
MASMRPKAAEDCRTPKPGSARRTPAVIVRHFGLTIGHGLPIPKFAMKRHEGKFLNSRLISDSKEFVPSN